MKTMAPPAAEPHQTRSTLPLEGPGGGLASTASVTWEEFSLGFARCFGRVYAYVGRRVRHRETCERIVSATLAENLDCILCRVDETQELSRLKASSDRLIRSELAKTRSTGTIGS
jgi:hypothetical protein